MADEAINNPAETKQQEVQFNLQRIYTRDISFETPNSPAIFQKEWKPEVKLDIDTRTTELDKNLYEVVLSVTVTATVEGEVAFCVKYSKQVFLRLVTCLMQTKHTC